MASLSLPEPKRPLWRRPWLWLAAAIVVATGAGSLRFDKDQKPVELLAPMNVRTLAGAWTRVEAKPLQLDGIQGVEQGMTFVYSGPETIMAHLLKMKTEASAFEAVQKWRTTAGMAVFYHGDLFIVVGYENPAAGQAFASAFLKYLAS
jgi:hypothetical protein